MAYLATQDLDGGVGGGTGAASFAGASCGSSAPASDRLTALEWSVVRLARRDRLSTVRPAGWLARALGWALHRRNPQLADRRLEALRRMAVLAWHHGYMMPTYEVRAFLAAGFSTRQYETVVDQIGAARPLPARAATA